MTKYYLLSLSSLNGLLYGILLTLPKTSLMFEEQLMRSLVFIKNSDLGVQLKVVRSSIHQIRSGISYTCINASKTYLCGI